MRVPPPFTRFMGHPAIATPVTIAGGFALFACFTSGEPAGLMTGAILLLPMGRVLKANGDVMAYRQWQRAWDSMSGADARPATRWARPLGAILGMALLACLVAGADRAQIDLALGWMALVGVVAAIAVIGRWVRGRTVTRPRNDATDAVRIVASPVLPVPLLADAYRALPDYCRVLLS